MRMTTRHPVRHLLTALALVPMSLSAYLFDENPLDGTRLSWDYDGQQPTAPVIICPADVTIECDESTGLSNTGNATATANCDLLADISFSDSVAAGTCPQKQVITRTWTATDNCENSTSCEQTVTVIYTTSPVITCPDDVTAECKAEVSGSGPNCILDVLGEALNVDPSQTGLATTPDNCDPAPVTTLSDSVVTDTCPQETVIARTWTATDDCGNSTSCEQTVTVVNMTSPAIICPDDVTVECKAEVSGSGPNCILDVLGEALNVDPSQTGLATAPNNCDPAPVITLSDSVVTDTCPQETVITRTWTATDDCGNSTSCEQTVTVVNMTSPVIICPDDVTLDCDASTATAVAGYASATNTCDPNPTVVFADSFSDGTCAQENAITRTWTATDACSNSASCNQAITITDMNPPIITFCSPDVIGEWPAGGALKAASPFEVTVSTKTTAHLYFGTGNSRGYVINGGQGDELTLVRGVTYAFNINGTFGHPFFIGTSAIGGSANTNSAVTDGIAGDGNFIVSGTLLFTPNADHPDLLWHQCGIHSFMGWRLNIVDDSATSTDNCDPSPSVTLTDSAAAGTCPIIQTITRKWTAQDSCGNTSTCIQTITLQDLTPPNIACPKNVAIECNASTAPDNTGQAAATDSCDPNPVVSFSDSSASSSCPQASSVTRIWTATDTCGNSTQCDQTIIVSDTVSPAISCPDDVTIECSASSAAGNTGQAIAIDACDPNPVITFSDSVNGGSCSYELIITRTWIAVDACGNGYSCRQTVSIADATAPVLTCPADIVIACTDSTVPDTIGQATATDSCDPGPTVSFSDAVTSGSCPHDSKITRTWTATDTCGNVSRCSQTIDVADGAAPILACPNNVTIACNESTAPDDTGQAMASDACDPSPAVAFSDSTAAGACPAGFTVSRKWTADDACGSGAQCVQTITVANSAAPALTCPADITINCNESTHETVIGSAVAIDTCSTGLTILFADNVADGTCAQENTLTRTWTVADACGNSSTCLQTITIIDETPPVLSCPIDIFQDHAPGISGAVVNFAVAAPVDCGEVTVAVNQESGSLFPRGETTLTVTATDPCGNTAGCSFAVTIENAVPEPKNVTESVVFNSTENVITVLDNDSDLDDDPLTVESVTAPDNGTVEITAGEKAVIYTPDTDFIGTDTFMYTVTDRHGGRASATVTVQVRPETAFSLFLDGATPSELVFGHSSIATIGFDDVLDIVAPEPNDSGATAYLLNEQIESLDRQQLLVEFLPTLIICRWRVVVNVPDGRQQVQLTWDVSAAAPERLIMLVPLDGESPTGTTLDMKQAKSVTVSENSVFEIAYGMKTELTVTLDSPWNLISVPVMTTQTISDVFSVAPRGQPPGISAWYWKADGYIQFDNDTPLQPEVGYWVFCDIAMESQIISGILADGVIDLLPNWNLVGPVDTVPPPDTPAIDKEIWCWETEIQDYEKIGYDPLRVPRAYWMYATEPTTIDLSNGQ